MYMVRDFVGHGLGRSFHETPPNIFHFGQPNEGDVLADGWTAVTKDRSLSAQYEHSIGVTKDGCEIFTLSPKGYGC